MVSFTDALEDGVSFDGISADGEAERSNRGGCGIISLFGNNRRGGSGRVIRAPDVWQEITSDSPGEIE